MFVPPCSAPPNLNLVSHFHSPLLYAPKSAPRESLSPPSHVKPGTDAAHPRVRRGTIKTPVRPILSRSVFLPPSIVCFPVCVSVNVRTSRQPIFTPHLVRQQAAHLHATSSSPRPASLPGSSSSKLRRICVPSVSVIE